jgi:hypothetical protein
MGKALVLGVVGGLLWFLGIAIIKLLPLIERLSQ